MGCTIVLIAQMTRRSRRQAAPRAALALMTMKCMHEYSNQMSQHTHTARLSVRSSGRPSVWQSVTTRPRPEPQPEPLSSCKIFALPTHVQAVAPPFPAPLPLQPTSSQSVSFVLCCCCCCCCWDWAKFQSQSTRRPASFVSFHSLTEIEFA